ncbi:MAG: PaaI family thioesterase [Paracoccaceae bacterium]
MSMEDKSAASRKPEPVQLIKQRRDGALAALVSSVPFISFLGVVFDRRGDELTAILRYDDRLIGNPVLPALHGGATAAFLEIAAIVELAWMTGWPEMERAGQGGSMPAAPPPQLPRTIDFTVDYLRPGLARDAYARARVTRSGRRYASVHVEAWQDNRARPFAEATGHFLMPAVDAAPE